MSGLEIAALALAAAGTGATIAANEQAKGEMEDRVKSELLRQKEYQKKASKVYQQSLGESTPEAADKQIKAGEAKAQEEYAKVSAVPLTASTPGLASKGQDSYQVADRAFTGALQKAGSTTQGFGNYSLQQYLKDLEAQQGLNVVSNAAQQSSQVLPYEVQDAAHSWDWLKNVGTGLSAAGSLAGIAGMFGQVSNVAGRAASAPQVSALMSGYGPASSGYANNLMLQGLIPSRYMAPLAKSLPLYGGQILAPGSY